MFNNIGKKIKGLAAILCWVGIIIYVLFAFIMFGVTAYAEEGVFALIGVAILIVGPLSAWVGSFFMYGFGELIDKTAEIAKNTACKNESSPEMSNADNERLANLQRLRSQNLITEEEYIQAVSKQN